MCVIVEFVLWSSPKHIQIVGVSKQAKATQFNTHTPLNRGGGAGTYSMSSRNKHKSWRRWRKTNWSIGAAASWGSAHEAGATCASTSSDWMHGRATWTTPKAQVAPRLPPAGLWPLTTWRSSRSTSSRTESCFKRFAISVFRNNIESMNVVGVW